MRSDDRATDEYPERQRIKSWDDLLALHRRDYGASASDNMRWVFRGDVGREFLRTKLERAFDLYAVGDHDTVRCEIETIRAFQRKAALYLDHEPDKDDILEWLALMRHHGAPVRLLDCTYSFYLAVYMALAENQNGTLWILNAARFNKPDRIKRRIESAGDSGRFEEIHEQLSAGNDVLHIRSRGDKIVDLAIICYLMENPIPLVYAVNPFRLNRRLTVQKGVLLVVGDPRISFRDNLRSCFSDDHDMYSNVHRVVLDFSRSERNAALRALRDMNISNEVLFPGLDGFAKSLAERFADPGILPP